MSRGAFDAAQWQTAWLLLAQPNYYHLGLAKRLIKGFRKPGGVAVSSASPDGTITSDLVGKYANRLFQFIPESLTASGNQSWPQIYPSPGFGDIPISLAGRDTELTSVRHPFAGGGCIPRRRRRRLDTWYAQSRRKLDVLHIAEPVARILEILEGGEELIRRDQPMLVLELAAAEEIGALAAYLEQRDYLLLDSALQPVVSGFSHEADLVSSLTETVFLALPKEFIEGNGLVKALWPNDKRLTSHPRWQEAVTAGFTREARNSKVGFAGRPRSNFHYPFNSQLICEGLYPAEGDDDRSWRWLGPKTSARVRLSRPTAGHYRLVIRIIGAAAELDVADVRVFLSGKLIDSAAKTTEDVSTLSASVEFAADEAASDFELVIAVPATYRSKADDGRLLGICISRIELVSLARGERV